MLIFQYFVHHGSHYFLCVHMCMFVCASGMHMCIFTFVCMCGSQRSRLSSIAFQLSF